MFNDIHFAKPTAKVGHFAKPIVKARKTIVNLFRVIITSEKLLLHPYRRFIDS